MWGAGGGGGRSPGTISWGQVLILRGGVTEETCWSSCRHRFFAIRCVPRPATEGDKKVSCAINQGPLASLYPDQCRPFAKNGNCPRTGREVSVTCIVHRQSMCGVQVADENTVPLNRLNPCKRDCLSGRFSGVYTDVRLSHF